MTQETVGARREIVILISSAVISAIVGTVSTVLVQRNFISKYEESSLMRELIPFLVSADPRQVDMALLILEGTVDHDRYNVLKKIIDRKVELSAEKALNVSVDNVGIRKPVSRSDEREINEMEEYAKLRPEWSTLVRKQLTTTVKPITRNDFLSLLENLDGRTTDKTLKQIIEITAKKINNDHYFAAYVGADWVLRYYDEDRALQLIGLSKSSPSKEDAEKIMKYAVSRGYDRLKTGYWLPHLVHFGEPTRTAGQLVDLENREFLEDLKKDNPFESIVNPPEYKSKFEDLK